MSIKLLKNVNFGTNKKGLDTIGYRLYHIDGSASGSRVASNVNEVGSNTGIYSTVIEFSDHFSGSILWDTGESPAVYAVEDYNGVEQDIDVTRHMTSGRWEIDKINYRMTFYRENATDEVSSYDLFDSAGNPSFTEVFERKKRS